MFETLKQMRQYKELSQVEAARNIGVSLGTYRLWELGAGKPNAENMESLVDVLGAQARTMFYSL